MNADLEVPLWPAHGTETLPWQQRSRGGARDDRMMRAVDASIPPLIAGLDFSAPPAMFTASEEALVAVGRADSSAAVHSAALGRFLIRTESVASSKIERISASADDYARALAGSRGNSSAVSMVAATAALQGLVDVVGGRGEVLVDDVLEAHHALMRDDPVERDHAGRFRDMQNWIGGSDYSPRGHCTSRPPPAASRG
ncbi:Fic family protein [Agromyces mangrovi Wang et al. 2018]|uniref:hypothetical protein n=1 Tax=Agromyces mangrovi TaxID=1858653 RepID=UPI0025731F56|nr:hypothetical protein [Agromyces mangrovi]BDZ64749.1 hypothetical protein GCM10025877_16870 [Agromyces mangrovi]